VKEILTCGERLGITEVVESPGVHRSVRHVLRYAVRGRGILRVEELLGTGCRLKGTRVDVLIRFVPLSVRNTALKSD
jgi:hypothetical protein